MNSLDYFMIYPSFVVSPDGRVCPSVPLPRNYRDFVPIFYKNGGKEVVENFTREIKEGRDIEIKLAWSDKKGLTNIDFRGSPGFDLDESMSPRFIEHNLGGVSSLYATAIATKYVKELLKINHNNKELE